MKAKDVLDWIVVYSINGEFLSMVEVPKEQNDEWWIQHFGFLPTHHVEEGEYLYYYASQIYDDIKDEFGNVIEPDAKIEICNTGGIYDYDYVLLYKMED